MCVDVSNCICLFVFLCICLFYLFWICKTFLTVSLGRVVKCRYNVAHPIHTMHFYDHLFAFVFLHKFCSWIFNTFCNFVSTLRGDTPNKHNAKNWLTHFLNRWCWICSVFHNIILHSLLITSSLGGWSRERGLPKGRRPSRKRSPG